MPPLPRNLQLLFLACSAAHSADLPPTRFPSAEFPLSSWTLPPPDPAVQPPGGLPPHFPIQPLLALAARQRIVSFHEDETSVTLTATLDEHLDLAAELANATGGHALSPVPQGPRIVAGQGSHPENLTFIKILNSRGIADIQFLAFDPSVKGGVNVAVARSGKGLPRIAAAPISAPAISRIAIFNDRGGKITDVPMPAAARPPFAIAGGDFLPSNPGGEFLIAPASGPAQLVSADGLPLRSLDLPRPGPEASPLRLEPMPNTGGGHDLLISSSNHWLRFSPDSGKSVHLEAETDRSVSGVFANAFAPDGLIAATEDPLRSIWLETNDGKSFTERDAGAFENLFWHNLGPEHAGAVADWKSPEEGKYVRSASYAHIRVEPSSPRFKTPLALENDPIWTPEEAAGFARKMDAKYGKPLDQQPLRMWEPTFTHRMSKSFAPWMKIMDPRTNLPRYAALDRDGKTASYSEGKGKRTSEFLIATYAYGLPALDSLYTRSLRGFLNALSPRFRQHPQRVFSLEPNHEHEISLGRKDSIGDFNPKMIEGFFLHLVGLHGSNIENLNRIMGTPFTTHFDAPRDLGRGPWDGFSENNPFYNAWYFYNRHIVNRRIANTFREALLAGFPPEVIKSHQIPDSFAAASTRGFSITQARITPVDYALSAGVGFGFTNYGVWFQKDNMLAAARSSGFDSIIFGEYNALTPDRETALAQLNHVFENGGVAVNCMYWPADWHPASAGINRAMEAAVHSLRANERPRPGYAGGIGRVIPFRNGGRVMNIASLGTGPRHTGLLKSLREDGSWEGSVYTVPFRTAIRVEPVAFTASRTATGMTRIFSAPVDGLEGGDQLEINFQTTATAHSELRFAVTHRGNALSGLGKTIAIAPGKKNHRYIVRSPLPAGGIVIALEHGDETALSGFAILRQTAAIARLHRGQMTGTRHCGGITFDLLD
jgi:hypothetical protein